MARSILKTSIRKKGSPCARLLFVNTLTEKGQEAVPRLTIATLVRKEHQWPITGRQKDGKWKGVIKKKKKEAQRVSACAVTDVLDSALMYDSTP